MRFRRLSAMALGLAVLLCVVTTSVADAPSADSGAPLYLSLGDSLAAGVQPDAQGRNQLTNQGYADVIGRRFAHVHPGLVTRKLSCGGPTTRTLIAGGGGCPGDDPSQLVTAEDLLRSHPGTVLVTVDIGDNDVEQCMHMDGRPTDRACVARGRAALRRNIPIIAQRLRAAAGPNVPIVGILDYDQYLALWLQGDPARQQAIRSVRTIMSLNALMASLWHQNGVIVADAGARFHTTDLTTLRPLPGVGLVPLAVQRICRWTWACSPPPVRHNDHANAAGYEQIAQAVFDALAATAKRS